MLSIKNLDVKYEAVQVLWDVSLSVSENELVAMIGANGAGKSTLLKTIAGLIEPSKGEILFLNEQLNGMLPHRIVRTGVSLIPERRELFGNLTVYENLKMGGYTIARDELETRVEWVYDHFPILRERKSQLARTLSGGEQQMLAIARGLMSKPRLLMLDEPSLGLAPKIVTNLFKLIERLNTEGITLLLMEQNVRKALQIANRAYVLENGKIVMEGESKDLMEDENVRKAYLGI
ncbi:MAG: ABC transporter ATP-binding protein [Candidatus Heimdallarchaeota archaeon]